MPKTKFQDFVFTIVMVFVMVYFMSLFNTAYALGGLTNDMFLSTLIEMPITYLFVLALELLLVGRVAPKIAFKLVKSGTDSAYFNYGCCIFCYCNDHMSMC